jgi:DNA topoisomerase-2
MAQPKGVGEKYKQHDLRSHIYELPDTWAGSSELTTIETFVYNPETKKMIKKDITYVPALYKCFDEVLVNALDHGTRLKAEEATGKKDIKHMRTIRVNVNKETGYVEVFNDGDGIEVEKHPELGIYIPEMIFGRLLTSANYDKEEEKVVGGKNGVGAKLTNIFSKEFKVETVDHRHGKLYQQRWFDNMKEKDKATVKSSSKAPYTKITFLPDYVRFGLPGMTDDTFELFRKRTMDACACTDATVTVYFNDEKIPYKTFESYADLYLGPKDEHPRVYESCNERWEVVATYSDTARFEQVSFVNGINTLRGGKHVDQITNQICKELSEMVSKKKKKEVKPQHIRDNLMVFVKSLIVNPSFDSQSKETLTTQVAKFGSKCDLSDKFFDKLYKTGITEKAVSLTEFHENKKLAKTDGKKTSRVLVNKLDDANRAGTKDSMDCTLILTEGDSAKTMAIAGLSVIGRDKYGVFPLKGKILNVKDAATAKISANDEITNLKKILGLEQGKDYKDVSSLRYGKIMIMTDQDHDGSHIKGLLFNLFQSLWPSLYKMDGFITSMLTPVIKAMHKGRGEVVSFYNVTDFERWKQANDLRGWTFKYYKGLGTSTEDEAKEYFRNLKITHYHYNGKTSDEGIDLAFNKKRADDRKDWLMQYNKDLVLDFTKSQVPYEEFIHKELIHFSNRDLERSINHLCDGLKESTRKILFTCLKRKLYNQEVRVAQLAGSVSEVSAYHHGEASLQQAIVGMAQIFVGANNINLLMPNGQFGTRIQGGADAASPRYIHTLLSPLARKVFREEDVPILKHLDDDGVPIEPEYYIPIIPMILINGGLGIGTGFSTNVPCHNPSDIIDLCMRTANALDQDIGMIENSDDLSRAYDTITSIMLPDVKPWYLGFTGSITPNKESSFASKGVYNWLDDQTVEVTELPVGTWTEDYKDYLTALITNGSNILKDFESHYTAKSVKFILKLYPNTRAGIEKNFETEFKLVSTKNLSTNNIHLYGADGAIRRYKTVLDVYREWACVRLIKYMERKHHQIKTMEHDYKILSAKVKFIQDIIDNKIKVMNKKRADIEEQLKALNYPQLHEATDDEPSGGSNYNYLLRMPIYQLTFEKKQELEKEAEKLHMAIKALRAKPIQHIWMDELNELKTAWETHKEVVEEEYTADRNGAKAHGQKKRVVKKK